MAAKTTTKQGGKVTKSSKAEGPAMSQKTMKGTDKNKKVSVPKMAGKMKAKKK